MRVQIEGIPLHTFIHMHLYVCMYTWENLICFHKPCLFAFTKRLWEKKIERRQGKGNTQILTLLIDST